MHDKGKDIMKKIRRVRWFYVVVILLLIQTFVTISVLLLRFATEKRRAVVAKILIAGTNESLDTSAAISVSIASLQAEGDRSHDSEILLKTNMSSENSLPTIVNRPHIEHFEQNISHQIHVSIHVIAFARPKSLKTLLTQLADADYSTKSPGTIDLYIRIDGGGPNEVVDVANEFEWTLGTKHVLHREIATGLRRMWTSIRPETENEVMMIFEDDLRVSPFYFIWAMHLLRQYGGNALKARDPSLFGISLSPLKMDEISYPFVDWDVSKHSKSNVHLFLHSVPSSWGSVFFADRWNEFLEFFNKRMEPQFYNNSDESLPRNSVPLGDPVLHIPNSRTNVWPQSWKRVLVEYCYGKVMYTMYTHIPGRVGFASPLQLTGAHSVVAKVPSDTADRSPTREMLKNHRVVRVLNDRNVLENLLHRQRVTVDHMLLFDLWGRPTSRLNLAIKANMFLDNMLSVDAEKYETLTKVWRGKTISVEDRKQYLIYQPQFGFSNQQIAFKNAAYWATCLNRTLVVPPIFVPRVSDQSISIATELVYFDDIFQFENVSISFCSGTLKTESLASFSSRGIRPAYVYNVHRNLTGDELSDVFFNGVMHWSSVPRKLIADELCSESLSIRKLRKYFAKHNGVVLAFNGMFKCSMIDSRVRTEALRLALFRPSKHLMSIRREVFGALRALGLGFHLETDCLCIQLRLGDFESVCNTNAPWLAKKRKTGHLCLPPAQNVSDAVARWQGQCVAVMTNDEERASAMIGKTNKTLITSSAVRSVISGLRMGRGLESPGGQMLLTILLEQRMCERSAWAVLNYYSTFGETVSLLRRSVSKSSVWW